MTASATLTLPAPAAPVDPMAGTLTFIGNATLLLRYGGFTILTDPTFIHKHEQTWLGWGLHTTRLTNPAMEIADLPPLDFILLSHFHGDHFDQAAEAGLDHTLPIVTTPQAAPQLARRGFANTWPIDPWRSLEIVKGDARLRVTATPGRHGPPLSDLVLPEVMGSVLDFFVPADVHRVRIYITGDTLIFDDLRELPRRFPDIDLALLHLGGTRVLGLLLTMDAAQGVEMLRLADPATAIPIHFDDYDVFTSPLSDFQRAVDAAGLTARVRYLARGETFALPVSDRTPSAGRRTNLPLADQAPPATAREGPSPAG